MVRPLVLVILDGWGYSTQQLGNAILSARTPTLDNIRNNYPSMLIQASGKSVGLSWNEPGNSEVGQLTIGAGRIIFQYSTRIDKAIEAGAFFENTTLLSAIRHTQKNNSTLHLVGLLGSGVVHSSLKHLGALIEMAQKQGITKLSLHLHSDGKDSGLKEAPQLIKKIQEKLSEVGTGKINSIIGRYYALDRDNNWDRTQATYNLLVNGQGEQVTDLIQKFEEYYQQGLNDINIPPVIADPSGVIQDNDAVIFFDFREDSMRQIAKAFVDPTFSKFPIRKFSNLFVAFMTQYIVDPTLNLHVAFPLPEINNGLAEILSQNGKKQLHIAESVKYAHTTYFFNCLRNAPFEGENDVLIESYKNELEHPEMRAMEIASKFVDEFNASIYDFTIMNLANADIMAHAGDLELTIKGVEAIDAAMTKIFDAVIQKDGILIITSDHGNAESLIYKETGNAETKHNNNPVPLYLVGNEYRRARTELEITRSMRNAQGLLSDVAPTILELMATEKSGEMTGESLLRLLI